MRFFLTCLTISLFIWPNSDLSAQQNIQVQFVPPGLRAPIEVRPGQNHILVKGLEPGKTYEFVGAARVVDQKIGFKLQLEDPALEAEAVLISRPNRPQSRIMIAQDNQVAILLDVMAAGADEQPAFLSINCMECERDMTWLNKFNEYAENNMTTVAGVAAASLINNTLIGGDCFEVSNISSTGNTNSRGTFANGTASIGIANGMVMATGTVAGLPGPNNQGNWNGGFGVNSPDDPDLATLTNGNQFDVSTIVFQFTPTSAQVEFEYVFGSDEYCEFANNSFNDVFGFFISGPGINGNQNIALLPSGDPVTINNVNHEDNTQYYVNNNNWNPCQGVGQQAPNFCQLDGWTTVLTATATLIPCETYTIKLAIADITDALYGSAVFLRANSFNAGGTVKADPIYPSGFDYVYEDCEGGFIRFRRSGDLSQPQVVNYTLGGTATPGVDYEELPNPIIIPAGQNQILIPVNVFADLIIEGDETIIITLANACSCDQLEMTFTIRDKPPFEIELDDVTECGTGPVTLTPDIDGGIAPYTYLWSTGSTQSSISVNTPGTNEYWVIVTDDCGTADTAYAEVTLAPIPTAALSGSGFLCAGQGGSVNLTITLTGDAPWEVVINGPNGPQTEIFNSSPATITVSDPGAYSLDAVESVNSGCSGTVSGSVTINEIVVDISLTPTNPLCNGGTSGSIQGSATGGNGPFNFNWSHGPTTPNVTNLSAGTYSVTVTNGNGCTNEASVTLDEPPALTADTDGSGTVTCIETSVSPDLTVDGGTPGYTFNWSGGGGNQQNPNFNSGGNYTVTVTDFNGCTTTATFTVNLNNTPPVAVAANPPQLDCNNEEISINGNGSSQGPDITYEWNGPGIVSGGDSLEPVVNAPGSYTLVVTNNDNGCTASTTVNVTQNITPPNAVVNSPGNISCTTPTLTLSGAGTSQGPGITFTWSTQDGNFTCCVNTLNPQIDQAGTYTITVVNANNGCTNEASVTITGDTEPPIAVANVDGIITCIEPEISLDGVGSSEGGNFTYQWNGPGITGGANTLNPTVNAPGSYTLIVTNGDNNCTATATVSVSANNTPPTAVIAPPPQITCIVTEVEINGNGSSQGPNFSYEWSGPNIICCETTLNPQVNGGGTYTLTVTNSENGCTATASVNVVENNTPPNAVANTPGNISCTTPTFTLSGAGTSQGPGITFTWSTQDGNFTCCVNTLNPQIDQAGTYTITVVNANNGCTNEAEVTVTGNTDPPTAVANVNGIVNCYEPEITLDGTGSSEGGNFTYQWNGPGITGGDNTLNPTVNAAGTYTLVVTNTENNCTATATVSVTANQTPPIAVANAPGAITCQNPTVTINGSGSSTGPNFSYDWTTGDGNIVSGENTLNPVVNQGGTYTLVVTNGENGCTASTPVTVNADQGIPNANAGPSVELNCINSTIQLQGSGSTGPGITIQWTPAPGNIVSGGNTYTPTVNQPGTYILTVTNTANGCSVEDQLIVTQNLDTPVAVVLPPDEVNCYTPEVLIDAGNSSQGGNIIYNWTTNNGCITGGGNTPYPTVDCGGVYTLVVTNTESGCTASATVTVQQNTTPPIAVAAQPGTLTCVVNTVSLNGVGSSNGPSFVYNWGGPGIVSGETTLNPVVNQAGIYTLTVTNQANGCTATTSVNVQSNEDYPLASAGNPLVLNCNFPSVQLTGSGSSGPGISISWEPSPGNIVSGGTTYTPTVNEPGFYILTVTNTANGCSSQDAIQVTQNLDTPTAVIAPPSIISCYEPTILIDAGLSSADPGTTYWWSTPSGCIEDGQGTPYLTVSCAGTYTITVTNTESGCTATASTAVQQNTTPPVAVAAPGGTLTCANPIISLSGIGSSNGPSFVYQWDTPNGNIVSGANTLIPQVDQAGQYILTVTNQANGCTNTVSVNVNSNQNFPAVNAGVDMELNCNNFSVQLNGAGSASGPGITYLWTASPGNIVSGATTLTPIVNQEGFYTLTVSNTNNGCTSSAFVYVADNIVYPVANIFPPPQLNCVFQTVELDASSSSGGPAMNFQWSTPNGQFVSGSNGPIVEVSAPGTYNLVITNTDNFCTATASVTVVQNTQIPTAVAQPQGFITCQQTQITISGEGSSEGPEFFYLWTTTNGNIVSGELTLFPVVSQVGQYTLTVFNNDNGCEAQITVNVETNQNLPIANAGPAQDITCANPQLTLDGSASSQGNQYNYLWNTQNGNIVSGATTLSPVVNAPGTYNLSVVDISTGCVSNANVTVGIDQIAPTAIVAPGGELSCVITSLELDGTGSTQGQNFTYAWTTVNGNILSGANTLNPTVNATGVYVLTVSNTLNGCTTTASTSVSADASLPMAAAGPGNTITCVLSEITLDGSASSQGADFSYQWTGPGLVSGATTLMPIVNAPGVYELLVTDQSNGCTAVSAVTINNDTQLPLASAGNPATLNCTVTQLTLDGSASSTGQNIAYVWSTANGNILSGANTPTPLIDAPGDYQLLVSNTENGCTAAALVTIAEDVASPTADAGPAGVITCVNATVTLQGTGSSGPGFSYLWTTANGNISSGENTLNPIVDAAGLYVLVVTNSQNTCTAQSQVNVTKDDDVPIATASVPGPITCAVSEIQINGTGSSQGTDITYAWTTSNGNIISGANTLTPIVNQPGQYTLTILNTQNACTATFTVTVPLNQTTPVAAAGPLQIISCQNSVVTLEGAGSSQGPEFSYQWTTTNGNILSGATTLNPQVNESGIYTLLVTNTQNGCTSTSNAQVLLDQNSPEAEAGPDRMLTCTVSSVTLDGTQSAFNPNFVYQWSTPDGNIVSGANTLQPVVNQLGTYTLLITNPDNGCTATDQVQVTLNITPPTANAGASSTLNCQSTSINLDGSGSSSGSGIQYQWQATQGGFILSGANTVSPVVNQPGVYNLTVINTQNGCTATASVQVFQDIQQPQANAGPTAVLTCVNDTYVLQGTVSNAGSDFSVNWTTQTGNILSGANTLNPLINQPGIYVLVVTNNQNFCTALAQVIITQNVVLPDVNVGTAETLTCALTQISLNGSGSSVGANFQYQWTTPNGNIVSGANTLTPVVNQPGEYTLVVTNANTSCTSSATVFVPQNIQQPVAEAGQSLTLSCNVASISLNGAGSSEGPEFTYQWSTTNGLILSGETTLTPEVGAPGLYQLQVFNLDNGCSQTDIVQVLQDINAPNVAAAVSGELTCDVTALTLSGAGTSTGPEFTYQWTTPDGNILSGINSLSPTVNQPGQYLLTVSNTSNGCTSVASVQVTQNVNIPTVSIQLASILNCTVTSLTLNSLALGGSAGITYAWSGPGIVSGGMSASPQINAPGLYSLTVKDNYNGCVNSAEILINSDTQIPNAVMAQPGTLTCLVTEVTLNAAGTSTGTEFLYAWNGPGIVSGADGLQPVVNQPGVYSLIVSNQQNGCTNSVSAQVAQQVDNPTAVAGPGFELTCSVDQGVLNAASTSTGPNFSYQWSTPTGNILNGSNTLSPRVDAPGVYTLLVTNNANGCTAVSEVVVTENTNYPSALSLATTRPKCGGQRGQITVAEVIGGVGPYLYSIDGGKTFRQASQFANLGPGQYNLVVQDANGCEYDEVLVFPVPVEPDISLGPDVKLDFGESTTLTATLNIPLSEVDTIIWSPMETLTLTAQPNVVIARPFQNTQYTVTVVNKDGCEDRARVIVRIDEPKIWYPNAIRPNGGLAENAAFTVFSAEKAIRLIRTLQIYDRWGNQVFLNENFQPNDVRYGWNGTFRGQAMNPAVFVWWAEVELESGQLIILKGDVTVVE